MVGFYEVCPLKALPKVDNVYVSGSADDQIRPEWEQSAARQVLGVEPVVIPGAGTLTFTLRLTCISLPTLLQRAFDDAERSYPYFRRTVGRVDQGLAEQQARGGD